MAALHSISKGRLRMQLTEFAGSAVAVYPAFRRVLGLSACAAQFLSQAVYWTERTEDGWFYKTETEWEEEIGLSCKEVRTARRRLVQLALLEEVRKGVPAKMHFRVDSTLLLSYLAGKTPVPVILKPHIQSCSNGATGSTQAAQQVLPDGAHKRDRKGRTITETTQEITQKTTFVVQLAPAAPKRAARSKDEAEQAKQLACRAIWSGYAAAYLKRHGAPPVRNGKVNKQVVELWKRLGQEAGPVAEYFVGINDAYLIRNFHDLGSLLAKCESFRTQWATNRQMNGTTARQIEETQANINAALAAAETIRSGEAKANAFL